MTAARRAALGGVLAALVLLHVLPNLPIAQVRVLSTDFLDPVRGALQILEGRLPWTLGSAIHGWGRDASYVPLVLGIDGWLQHAARRAWVQGWVPIAVFWAAAWLSDVRKPGALLGPALAAALISTDVRLVEVVRATHQSYLGVEWGGVFAVGLAGIVTGRGPLAAVMAGGGLAMMVFNTPYAMAAAPALGLAALWRWRQDGQWRPGAWAIGIGAFLSAPHVWLLLTGDSSQLYPYGDEGGMLDRMRATVGEEGLGIGGSVAGYLSGLLDPVGLALAAGVLAVGAAALVRRGLAPLGVLVVGVLLAVPVGGGLTLWVIHSKPWHVLPMLPLMAALCGAGMAAGLGAAWGRRAVAVPLVVAAAIGLAGSARWTASQRFDLQATAEEPYTARHLARVAGLMAPPQRTSRPGARAWLGDLGPKDSPRSYFLALHLQAYFAAEGSQGDGPRVLYAVGDSEWIALLADIPLGGGAVLATGDEWLLVSHPDEASGHRWESGLCAARDAMAGRSPVLPEVMLYVRSEPGEDWLNPCLRPNGDP